MSPATVPSADDASAFRRDAGLIGLVGVAHGISHFSQLLLAPLFPWLRDAFQVGYAELGLLLTVFFTVSCAVQALCGFIVDRHGPRPVLFAGVALLGVAGLGFAVSQSYWMLMGFAVVAGMGNGVFHPADYTLFNRKVSPQRLGHAYSVHGISGNLGWALGPAFVVPIAIASSWRVAMACAGLLAFAILALLWWKRQLFLLDESPAAGRAAAATTGFGFLRIPAVWMCFGFFFFFAMSLGIVQAFAPESARQLHAVPVAWAAMCLTIYMVASAGGMVLGGFLAKDPSRCERIVGAGFGVAAAIALTIGLSTGLSPWMVPALFGAMGFFSGIAGPSRDLLVKRSTPANASGRVYGVVYAGLDIGQAISPLIFGVLMDRHQYRSVWIGLAIVQGVLIASAFNVGRVRRDRMATA
jgi:MFS family permease